MSEQFTVRSQYHDYEVRFIGDIGDELDRFLEPGDVILIDSNVHRIHWKRLGVVTAEHATIDVKATEESKSYREIGKVIEDLVSSGCRKQSRIIALGGGITQDICGFISTVLYRGVDWIFCPTTLLAQGDSCIGGKSSVNFAGYKNVLGSFYPPREILVDNGFLLTLPEDQITSGLGEILHFLVLSSESDFQFMEENLEQFRGDPGLMRDLIERSLSIKKRVIEEDEFDKGLRQLFNYGHSFGHALEAVTDYAVPHGVAVSMGIDIANYLSQRTDLVSSAFRERVRDVAEKLWDGCAVKGIDIEAYFSALRRDKKNIGSDVYVILTRGFGEMFKTRIDLGGREGGLIRDYFESEAL